MTHKFNPFRPGSIVTPGMFAGRYDELIALERALHQTKHGNPCHFLLHGERGIGKSSLLFYLQTVAQGRITALDESTLSFLTVGIELEPSNTYGDIIKKIGAELQRCVHRHNKLKGAAVKTWEFLKRWEVMGVKYSDAQAPVEPYELLEELAVAVQETLEKAAEIDGLVILIDEADKPSSQANLGEFAKLFTERLMKRDCPRVCLGLAGLPEVLAKLKASHESSARLFQLLTLEPLALEESISVVRMGLGEAKKQTGVEITITDEAEAVIAGLSEGYPHFLQQMAYCAVDADNDNRITKEDVLRGATSENGALHQLGVKYFQEQYLDQIGSDHYRKVLQYMAQHGTNWVSKQQIRSAIEIKETILTNALSTLKKRHIIVARAGHQGQFRLPTNSFAAWIRAFASSEKPLPTNSGTSEDEPTS